MMWKNVLVKYHHWISTSFEIAVPMLFMFLLVWIKSLTKVYDSPAVSYACGQTPPWFYTDQINPMDPQSTQLLTCLEKPIQCGAEHYYHWVPGEGNGLSLPDLYTKNGYVKGGKHYPFYAFTVGDDAGFYDQIQHAQANNRPSSKYISPIPGTPNSFCPGLQQIMTSPEQPYTIVQVTHSNRPTTPCPPFFSMARAARGGGGAAARALGAAAAALAAHLSSALGDGGGGGGEEDVVRAFDSEGDLERYVRSPDYDAPDYEWVRDPPGEPDPGPSAPHTPAATPPGARLPQYGKVAFAVVVREGTAPAAHRWDYALRVNSTLLSLGQPTTDCLYGTDGECVSTYMAPTTLIKTLPLQQPILADFMFGYSYSGFLTLQKSIDESPKLSGLFKLNASFGLFPTKAYTTDEFKFVIASTLGIFYMLAYLLPVSRMIRSLVLEKELRIKEGLQMMGLNPAVYTASHWITMAIQIMISTGLMVAATATTVFKYSDSWLIYLYFLSFGVAIISLCFLISTFFSRSKTAATLGPVIFFALFFPYFPASALKWGVRAKTWACLAAPTCFALGADAVAAYEGGLVGVHTFNTGERTGDFSFARCVGLLALDALLYAAAAWYTGKVFPSEFGVREPWYFPLARNYWRRALHGSPCWAWCCGPLFALLRGGGGGGGGGLAHRRQGGLVDGGGGTTPAGRAADGTVEPPSPELMRQVLLRKPLSNVPRRPAPRPTPAAVVAAVGGGQVGEGRCVELRHLRKSYGGGGGQGPAAVAGLDLLLFEGQITALLGHNGAGKSTTINMLTGLIPMTSGEALIRGKRLSQSLAAIRSDLGVCPQHDVLLPELSPMDHLNLVCIIKGVPPDGRGEARRMLEQVGLAEKARAPAATLSGGQKRKLCVGLALVGGSRVVILDEPTSGMDPYSR
ncbi:unnamed protein product [Heterosigma akashiwo]